MIIVSFPSGPFLTNAIVIGCEKSQQAVIIDPAPGSAASLKQYITEHHLIPIAIWLTHSHWDHIADVAELKQTYNIPISIHQADHENLENPGSDGIPTLVGIKGSTADHYFVDGDSASVGEHSFRVIHTPGHSPGGICLYCEKENVLIAGDTLFRGSIGNLSLPTASPSDMWSSLDKLAKLPPETRVYPGHGETTTIGSESWLPKARSYFG